MAVRWNITTGVAQRTISSAVVAGRSRLVELPLVGVVCKKACMPWLMALRVVSLPATARISTNQPNSSERERRRRSVAATSLVTMSSAGHALRSSPSVMA